MPAVQTTEIEIKASASRVWTILCDLHRYPEWNPFVVKATGELRRGQHLDLTLAPPDRSEQEIRMKVLEADPLGRLSLQCVGLGGHDHQIILEPVTAGVKVLQLQRAASNGDAHMGDRLHLGAEMMNAALKARAER